jgi:leader peptidase (prepilin peptidase) / N-methyltransferase
VKFQFFLMAELFILSFFVGIILRKFICYWPKLMQKKWRKLYEEFLQLNQFVRPVVYPMEIQTVFHLSTKYFLIEFVTALITMLIINRFGFTWMGSAVVILAWGLIVLSGIDATHQLLPDNIVLPLLWFGLWLNGFGFFVSPAIAISGAVLGYISLWIISKIYRFIRGVEGIGGGDFKLLAMWGAWLGSYPLILIVLIAAVLASIIGGIKICYKRQKWSSSIAFGPYLAFAGMLVLCLRYPTLTI